MKPSFIPYINASENYESFKELILKHFPNFNIDNEIYLYELFDSISNVKIKGKVSFINECSMFLKERRNGKSVSNISKDYWISMGWDDASAIQKVSDLQRSRSVLTVDYWIKKGFSKAIATIKIKQYQSNNSKKRYAKYSSEEISEQSVWSKSYWINKGYSEDDAQYEVDKRNYGKREFWTSNEEYEYIRKLIGKKTSKFIKENPEKYKSFFGSISKEEIIFFNELIKHNEEIKHKQFIINIKKSKDLDQGIIKYDGYLKTNKGIVLIEYDGLYWHNQSYDEIKDSVALDIRNDIIGIIRVSCEKFKTNQQKCIKYIENGIEKIKNKKCNRIKIY